MRNLSLSIATQTGANLIQVNTNPPGSWLIVILKVVLRENTMSAAHEKGVKSPIVRLSAPTSLPSGDRDTFLRIVKASARAIAHNRQQAIAGDADAIHAMRIALTTLRAAACFFDRGTDDSDWTEVEHELTWLNSALGRARDRDVTAEYANRKRYRQWARRSRDALLRAQRKAHRRLGLDLRSARFALLMSSLNRALTKRSHGRNNEACAREGEDYCEQRLLAWREQILEKGRHIGLVHRKQLHAIRIQAKHYRYMVDSLVVFGQTVSREDFVFAEILKQVSQDLGRLRDIRRLRKSVGRRPPHYGRRKRKLMSRIERSFRRVGSPV
jgi:CHAD domain-containing protein